MPAEKCGEIFKKPFYFNLWCKEMSKIRFTFTIPLLEVSED